MAHRPDSALAQEARWGGGKQGGCAARAQLARATPGRASSVRELMGSEEAFAKMLEFLGAVGDVAHVGDWLTFGEALALGRLVPGVCVLSYFRLGPAGSALLQTDACLGALALIAGSSWPHVFSALERNTGLRTLDLSECELQACHVALLAEALLVSASLAELELGDNALGDAAGLSLAAVLTSNATLRVLGLRNTNLGDVAGAALGAALESNTGLQGIDLGENGLGEVSGRTMAVALTSNTTLRRLGLSSHGLGDGAGLAVAVSLLVNRTLRELDLRNTGLGKASGAALVDVVRENPALRVLDLSENRLVSSSWALVLAALEDNVELHTLRVGTCGLTADDGRVLAAALQKRKCRAPLQELVLRHNRVLGDDSDSCDSCAGIIAVCVGPGLALRKLDLCDTGMGRLAGCSLGRFLHGNTTLRVLDLSYNELADDWAGVLFALTANTGLKTLALARCGLDKKAVEVLGGGIYANRSLQELDLTGNDVGDDGACFLVSRLKFNKSLRKLNLSFNWLGNEGAEAFADLFNFNPTLRELSLRGKVGISDKDAFVQAGRAAGCSVLF